jgi:hypothetical protein
MAASGTFFRKKTEDKEVLATELSFIDAGQFNTAPLIFATHIHDIELNEFDSNENNPSDYVRLDGDTSEHFIEIKNEVRPLTDQTLSNIVILKQQLQACIIPLKKEVDLISWTRLSKKVGKYSMISGGLTFVISVLGAAASAGNYIETKSETAGDIFLSFDITLALGAVTFATGFLMWGLPQHTCRYPFSENTNIPYPPSVAVLLP